MVTHEDKIIDVVDEHDCHAGHQRHLWQGKHDFKYASDKGQKQKIASYKNQYLDTIPNKQNQV
jgi:hypothetical protein